MDKIGSSYFELSILSEKSKISAQSHRFVGLGTGSILPKSAKLLLEQSSTSHSRIISDVSWWPGLIRSAPIALQRWLANFLKISPFFVFCCILGLIFAKSQIFNFGDFWKFSVTFLIIFKCPEYFSTLKMWLEIDFEGYWNFRFFMVSPSILQNFKTTCSFSQAFSQT